jgi:hypothetical protein
MAIKDVRCNVSIERDIGYEDGRSIRIIVTDETSGVRVCEIGFTPEEFGLAVTGRYVPGGPTLRLFDNHRLVGAKREVKEERVYGRAPWGAGDEDIAKMLAPFEVEGWTGVVDDLRNGHRAGMDHDRWYHSVRFVRYVDGDGVPILGSEKESG